MNQPESPEKLTPRKLLPTKPTRWTNVQSILTCEAQVKPNRLP